MIRLVEKDEAGFQLRVVFETSDLQFPDINPNYFRDKLEINNLTVAEDIKKRDEEYKGLKNAKRIFVSRKPIKIIR